MSPVNQCIPFFDETDNLTATATAVGGVVGKTAVKISGSQQSDGTFSVATAAEGDKVFGIAEYNATQGQWVGIVREGVVPVTCGAGDLAADTEVMADATGLAIAWDATVGHRPFGLAVGAATPGNDTPILLYR
jgi:hypothetical protein